MTLEKFSDRFLFNRIVLDFIKWKSERRLTELSRAKAYAALLGLLIPVFLMIIGVVAIWLAIMWLPDSLPKGARSIISCLAGLCYFLDLFLMGTGDTIFKYSSMTDDIIHFTKPGMILDFNGRRYYIRRGDGYV